MTSIADILCRRDGVTREEAEEAISRTRQRINESNLSFEEVESIMYDELGLEMDYIFELI